MDRSIIMSCSPGDVLTHLKTGNEYTFLKTLKLKVNGQWRLGTLYKNESGEEFCREVEDFKGFEKK